MTNVDIKFIAKKAGVSPATVSRVLNHTKTVSEELEKRVMEMVRKYHYYPNSIARGLVTKRTRLIAHLTDEQLNIFQTVLVSRMAYYAAKKDYKLMNMPCGSDFQNRLETMELLQQQQFEGIMTTFSLQPDEMEKVQKRIEIPVIDNSFYPGGESIMRQNHQAVFRAISYLAELGHRKIGGIFPHIRQGELIYFRYEGFLDALKYYRCPINDRFISTSADGMEGAIAEVKRMVSYGELPTAMFCYCDEAAIGIILYLEKNGIRVPQDISIIGFDGIQMGQMIEPKLTTIVQPVEHLCKNLVEWMISKIERSSWSDETEIEKEYMLLRGESCRSIRSS